MGRVAGDSVVSADADVAPSVGATSFSRVCRMEMHLLSVGFGRKVSNPHLKDQNLASCRWTTPDRLMVEGSMGTAPITRGWKPRVYLSTP